LGTIRRPEPHAICELSSDYNRLYNRGHSGGKMTQISQRRAVANHRRRLAEHGISRYEVRGLAKDKELVRKLAKRLVADDAEAARLRTEIMKQVSDEPPRRGGIWAALRRSPLVGAELNLEREVVPPRDVDL
jgi:hypothetical protein